MTTYNVERYLRAASGLDDNLRPSCQGVIAKLDPGSRQQNQQSQQGGSHQLHNDGRCTITCGTRVETPANNIPARPYYTNFIQRLINP